MVGGLGHDVVTAVVVVDVIFSSCCSVAIAGDAEIVLFVFLFEYCKERIVDRQHRNVIIKMIGLVDEVHGLL